MENTKLTSLDKLQRIAVITPQFRIWTGETVLKATDFIIGEGGELPDSEFASLGRKALIDKQHLNVFRNLRDNFRKECGSIGADRTVPSRPSDTRRTVSPRLSGRSGVYCSIF